MSILSEQELTKAPSYSREFCERYFGRNSSAKLATELKRTSPETYQAVRAVSVQYGLIDAQREHVWARNVREQAAKNAPRSYSDEELLARAAFSESECRELLTKKANDPGQNLGDLAKDKAQYAKFRAAAISYGLLAAPSAPGAPGSNGPKAPSALQTQLNKANHDATTGHIIVSDVLADSLRIPRGTRVPPERLSALIELSGSIEAARAAAQQEDTK